jgi:predicted phage terminase large subunit-like protein
VARDTDARWNDNDHRWTFPSGATLTFAHLQHEDDKYNYQGAAFQFIGFDELTQFTETQYTYLFSRMPAPEDALHDGPLGQVPLRIRAASNPGGPGHDWVKQRFGIYRTRATSRDRRRSSATGRTGRTPAACSSRRSSATTRTSTRTPTATTSPSSTTTRASSSSTATGTQGRPATCSARVVRDRRPGARRLQWVRFWDLAATEPTDANPDPDWTVGLKLGRARDGLFYVLDVRRLRGTPGKVREAIQQTAQEDGPGVPIRLEQEPGSSGKTVIDDYVRNHLAGFNVKGQPSTGKKFARAQPVSSKAEHGLIKLLRGAWIPAFLDEHEAFGEDPRAYAHDDQVDAHSGAFEVLAATVMPTGISRVPKR